MHDNTVHTFKADDDSTLAVVTQLPNSNSIQVFFPGQNAAITWGEVSDAGSLFTMTPVNKLGRLPGAMSAQAQPPVAQAGPRHP